MFNRIFNYFQREPIYGGQPRSSQWRKVRNLYIKDNNYCAACGKTKMLQVHHIVPYHLNPDLELDFSNLITLGVKCSSGNHHYLFGHLEDWMNFNEKVEEHCNEMFRLINRI